MTRAELVDSIKGLVWTDNGGLLRCAAGDCPIIAAYRIAFPGSSPSPQLRMDLRCREALGLPLVEANQIIWEADSVLPLGDDLRALLSQAS